MYRASPPDLRPLVTIAIPTYNRAETYLATALESALRQTYPRTEILVSDNASTDGTAVLVRRFTDARLRYIRHETNIGANRNFNICLEQAAGDYFLLLHDDDLIDEDFVATCMEAAGYQTTFGLIRTGVRIIDDRGQIIRTHRNEAGGLPAAEYFLAWFAGKTCWYLANTLFHTGRLRAIGGFQSPHRLVEDGFAIARLAAQVPRLDVAAMKSSFRVHRGEKTFSDGVNTLEWGRDYLELLDCMCELVSADKAPLVRRQGMTFFARLTYDRAGAIESRTERLRAYFAIWRFFHYGYLPTHRFAVRRFALRAIDFARRCLFVA